MREAKQILAHKNDAERGSAYSHRDDTDAATATAAPTSSYAASLTKRRTLSVGRTARPALETTLSVCSLEEQLRQLITTAGSQDSLDLEQDRWPAADGSSSAVQTTPAAGCSPLKAANQQPTQNAQAINVAPDRSALDASHTAPCRPKWSSHAAADRLVRSSGDGAEDATTSRSSSLKYHANLAHLGGMHHHLRPAIRRDASNSFASAGGKLSRPISISRSKSDIGHRALQRAPKSKDEQDRFFATIGLDSSTWAMIQSGSQPSTPTRFFDSVESIDSVKQLSTSPASSRGDTKHSPPPLIGRGGGGHAHHPASTAAATNNNDCGQLPAEKQHLTLSATLSSCGLSRETSIVEKNARIIKWLYNLNQASLHSNSES